MVQLQARTCLQTKTREKLSFHAELTQDLRVMSLQLARVEPTGKDAGGSRRAAYLELFYQLFATVSTHQLADAAKILSYTVHACG